MIGTTQYVSQVASWGGKILGPAYFKHFFLFLLNENILLRICGA
jgi:hypothetical protein